MSPGARLLLGEKLEQLKAYKNEDQIAINARDLRAFGFQVDETIPDGNPVFLTVGNLREIASEEAIEPVVEDCGCPELE